jgi:hypothetical protein
MSYLCYSLRSRISFVCSESMSFCIYLKQVLIYLYLSFLSLILYFKRMILQFWRTCSFEVPWSTTAGVIRFDLSNLRWHLTYRGVFFIFLIFLLFMLIGEVQLKLFNSFLHIESVGTGFIFSVFYGQRVFLL